MSMTATDTTEAPSLSTEEIRESIRELCEPFPSSYWRELERDKSYPVDFVAALQESGIGGAMIPTEYGGLGLGIREASLMCEELNHQGANGNAIHAQMFAGEVIIQSGSEELKQAVLPKVASGELRLQAFSITEPSVGTDTTRITTTATRNGDSYLINGQKVFTSRAAYTDLMMILARTSPVSDNPEKPARGISVFVADVRDAIGKSIRIQPIDLMYNHHTYEVFFDDFEVPASALVGEEGRGFYHLLAGLNAERILVAAECVGDGRFFVEKAVKYANERVVFGRPIGQNQGVQFPIARSHIEVEAADLMRWRAVELFDAGEPCGAEANMAKLLASEAAWGAANTALQTHGGYGITSEYDIERKFRETRVQQVAPVSTNMVLNYVGAHVLGMPKSY
jgi:acyl-CoA dehydrogenase